MEVLCARLGARQHIEREKAVEELKRRASADSFTNEWPVVKQALAELQAAEAWESQLGALLGAKAVIPHVEDDEYDAMIREWSVTLLVASEVRVRLCVGEVLGVLASKHGSVVWEHCKTSVLESIHMNFERDEPALEAAEDDRDGPGSPALGAAGNTSLMGALLEEAYKPATPGVGNLRHGTEGWKCLETSVRCLHEIVLGCGPAFAPFADPPLRQLLYRCFGHMNRFVREAGYLALAALCSALAGSPALDDLAQEIASKLMDGLSDNWSQVRYAASRAVRELMLGLTQQKDAALAIVLPGMCLNRYYVAEGVRLYSQETWKLVVGENGRSLVAKHIDTVVPYYISQSKANNHAVREAACACIAEVADKVDRARVEPHVQAMLRALLNCFKDASWPVRDASCTACSSAVANFPEAAAPVLEELYALWLAHLWDNIASVRENSAESLGRVARTLGPDAVTRICAWLDEHLLKAKEQAEESVKFADLENVTTFGVAGKKVRDNDVELHSNQTMFSCGSLAPKLQRGGGCMDHGFTKPKEPWEASDGALYMLRELAALSPERAFAYLPQAADIASMHHFAHSDNLRETLWKCLPEIAKADKKGFKNHLELFLVPMFRDLQCEHQLCECAAGRCIALLRDMMGATVFMARLNSSQAQELNSNPSIPQPVQSSARSSGSQPGTLAAMMTGLPPGAAIPNLLGKR